MREVARGDKPYLRKSTDRQAQIRKASVPLSGLICALRSVDFLSLGLSPEPPHAQSLFLFPIVFGINIYYRKRGSASYIVREVHSVRERDTEREKDGSDVTIVALKLAMSFALLLAKNVHLSIGEEFCAFPCQKNCISVSAPLEWR